MPDELVLDHDFDSASDGECPPFIGKTHANDSDGDDSEDEWVDEEDFDPHSCSTKSRSQTLQFGTKAHVPSKSAFVDQKKSKNKRKPPRLNNKQGKNLQTQLLVAPRTSVMMAMA